MSLFGKANASYKNKLLIYIHSYCDLCEYCVGGCFCLSVRKKLSYGTLNDIQFSSLVVSCLIIILCLATIKFIRVVQFLVGKMMFSSLVTKFI